MPQTGFNIHVDVGLEHAIYTMPRPICSGSQGYVFVYTVFALKTQALVVSLTRISPQISKPEINHWGE